MPEIEEEEKDHSTRADEGIDEVAEPGGAPAEPAGERIGSRDPVQKRFD
jgi:hypothetical protein